MFEILTKEEKLKFLKALEEDTEFRYAVAGALGVLEIMKRLDAIESRIEEHSKRIEELTKKIEEHSKRIEELTKKIEEHSKRIGDVVQVLMEYSMKIDELSRRVSNLELVVGALAESTYARYVYEDLEKELVHRNERIIKKIRNARIDETEIDLVIETDTRVYVVEIKVKPRHEDIGALLAKIDLVKKNLYPDKDVVGIIAGALIGREIEVYAKEKNIAVYTY
ncbi:MAG: hypothetical protein QW135_06785 [Ignisphaera sp.]